MEDTVNKCTTPLDSRCSTSEVTFSSDNPEGCQQARGHRRHIITFFFVLFFFIVTACHMNTKTPLCHNSLINGWTAWIWLPPWLLRLLEALCPEEHDTKECDYSATCWWLLGEGGETQWMLRDLSWQDAGYFKATKMRIRTFNHSPAICQLQFFKNHFHL